MIANESLFVRLFQEANKALNILLLTAEALHSADICYGLDSQLGGLFEGILLLLLKAHGEAQLHEQAKD